MALKATRSYIEAIATALSNDNKITFKESNQWRTDVVAREIEYIPQHLTDLPANIVKGLLLHETAHVKFTHAIESSELSKQYPALEEVYNALEDIRIEQLMTNDYGDYAIEGLEANTTNSVLLQAESAKKGLFKTFPKLHQFLIGLLSRAARNNYYNDYIYDADREIVYNMDKEVSERLYHTLNADKIIDNALRLKSTEEVQEYTDKAIFPYIKDFLEDQEQQKQMQAQPLHSKKRTIPSLKGNGQATKIPDDKELELLLSPYINTLARRLEDVLKERAITRFTGSYKHGKLLSKNAYKVLTDERRVFSKKINPNKPHYTISFLLDESGSMGAEKQVNLYIATYLLKRACEKLKFKIKYQAYETTPRMMTDLSGYRKYRGGGNNEDQALKMIRRYTTPEEDNIVFMMTDGGACVDPRPLIHKMTQEGYLIIGVGIELGSDDLRMLRQYYPITAVAKDAQQLPIIMIDLLRKVIHR